MTTHSHDYDVIVVGAGISGLSAALKLHDAGLNVCVLEKEHRVGGRVSTDRINEFVIDRGATIFGGRFHHMKRLLKRLKLEAYAEKLNFAFELHDGKSCKRIRRARLDDVLFNPKLSFKAKLALLRFGISVLLRGHRLGHGKSCSAHDLDDMSVEQYFDKIGGKEILDHFLHPGLNGPLGGNLKKNSRLILFQTFWNILLMPTWAIRGGMDRITEAMRSELNVRTGVEVTKVEIVTSDADFGSSSGDAVSSGGVVISSGEAVVSSGEAVISSGEAVVSSGEAVVSSSEVVVSSGEVVVSSGEVVVSSSGVENQTTSHKNCRVLLSSGETLTAKKVVIALPGHFVPKICEQLPAGVKQLLNETVYGKMVDAHVMLSRKTNTSCAAVGVHETVDCGYEIEVEHNRVSELCPEGKGLVSVFMWDEGKRIITTATDDEIRQRAEEIVRTRFPECKDAIIGTHIVRWNTGIAHFAPGRLTQMCALRKQMREWSLPIQLCGDYLDGIASESALATGEEAAENLRVVGSPPAAE